MSEDTDPHPYTQEAIPRTVESLKRYMLTPGVYDYVQTRLEASLLRMGFTLEKTETVTLKELEQDSSFGHSPYVRKTFLDREHQVYVFIWRSKLDEPFLYFTFSPVHMMRFQGTERRIEEVERIMSDIPESIGAACVFAAPDNVSSNLITPEWA